MKKTTRISLLASMTLLLLPLQASRADRTQTEFFHAFLAPYIQKTCKDDNAVFRRCFTIKPAECEKSVRGMAKLCEQPLSRRMPQTFKSRRDTGYWGSQYSVCIASRFADYHVKNMKKEKGCERLLSKKMRRKQRLERKVDKPQKAETKTTK